MEAEAEEAEEAKEKAIAEPIQIRFTIGRTAVKTPETKTTLIHQVEAGAMEVEVINLDAAMEDAEGGTINITTTTKVITTSKTVKTTGTTTTTSIQTSKVTETETVTTTTNHITTRVLRELVGTTMQTNPTTGTDNQIIL